MNCDISVGVDPVGVGEDPLRVGVRVPPCDRADRVARTVRRAEELGFDQVWFPDSQLLWRDVFAFCTGYLREPEPGPAEWRRTGDRVVREPDGWFRFVDRIKDVIRRRGENVSSHEVESAVRAHPAVADAAAFPVPSELAEDEVMVAVVPVPGQVLDLRDLVRHCAEELPPFAVPRYIDTLRELPLTETGKVRKATLRERGVTDTTWDRSAPATPARHQT